jgi:hypothetical protein
MNLEILSREDFISLKQELLQEIRQLINPTPLLQKEWLKSADVMKMLNCSPGTLQNLRINGTLPFTKMGGTIYYAYADVISVLNSNKKNAA